jgi:putative hydrolase of the HAD superfamily
MSPSAVGFDLGDTLFEYAGVPLNWEREYPAVLTAVAAACGVAPTPDRLRSGASVLLRYNTRRIPRPEDREYPAERFFGDLLAEWTVSSEHLLIAIKTFFGHFRRTLRSFADAAAVLSELTRLGIPVGVLTDVPYGMPMTFVAADISDAGLSIPVERVLTSTTVGYRKPHPAGFLALSHLLGVSCDRLTFVGNERKDVVGGNAAGCETVLLWRSPDEPPSWGQAFTIRSLGELFQHRSFRREM